MTFRKLMAGGIRLAALPLFVVGLLSLVIGLLLMVVGAVIVIIVGCPPGGLGEALVCNAMLCIVTALGLIPLSEAAGKRPDNSQKNEKTET